MNHSNHSCWTSSYRLISFFFFTSTCFTSFVQSICDRGCDLAFGSYYIEQPNDIASIAQFINTSTSNILKYNPNTITNEHILPVFTRINVPFSCDCLNGELLMHVFNYEFRSVDTYERVAQVRYANLTTAEWIQRFNSYDPNRVPDNVVINVTVDCSCGDGSVSKDYGLFVTYPLRPGETLESVSSAVNLSPDLIRSYNPDVDFSKGSGLVYIPGRDEHGNYPPFKTSCSLDPPLPIGSSITVTECSSVSAGGIPGITVDKSMEFSYEELSTATCGFSHANEIGQGGFGAVYYAELRGEKAAIKKMDMQASRQFLAELKVLTHTHHVNPVRLIGYCVESSLFLVYEYIENGNLSQHLHGSGREPLPWFIRVQVALDSARGLEYIHEHIIPVCVHCDIKSENILIDKNFHGKVADFGITRLSHVVGSKSCLGGTFGYMPPEYVQYGDVSPKVDVYAFGVVLYELISAKKAITKAHDSDDETKGLVALFDEVLSEEDPKDDLIKMIDPKLEDNYPLGVVHKMAQLAKACTCVDPQRRPGMRSIVVALMTLQG